MNKASFKSAPSPQLSVKDARPGDALFIHAKPPIKKRYSANNARRAKESRPPDEPNSNPLVKEN
jgi:hypothetical protein